ncbi:MAG: hypothetical protein LBT60_03770, partial [Oscillospiraceae bacterium]|nr:hypothetical protein [Oscillospiraceae bacterium]
YKGAKVWKKGVGILTAPQYLFVAYGPDSLHIEAFIKYALLPGVYIGEMGITGFFGAAPKGILRSRVTQLENYIASLWQNAQPSPWNGQPR